MTALFDTWVTGGLPKLFLLIGEIHELSADLVRTQGLSFRFPGNDSSADYACQQRGFSGVNAHPTELESRSWFKFVQIKEWGANACSSVDRKSTRLNSSHVEIS